MKHGTWTAMEPRTWQAHCSCGWSAHGLRNKAEADEATRTHQAVVLHCCSHHCCGGHQ